MGGELFEWIEGCAATVLAAEGVACSEILEIMSR